MTKFIFLISLIFALRLSAQTPHIMHLRLGGTEATFLQNMQDPNSVIRQTNFGLGPAVFVKRAVIDSIIAVNDSTVVVVTSHQTQEEYWWNETSVYDSINEHYVCSDSMIQRFLTYDSTGMWMPGRDTVVNHAVFNAKLRCEQINEKLFRDFGLRQSSYSIVYIGFDCSEAQQRSKRNFFPFIFYKWPQNPNFWLSMAVGLSLLYFLVLQMKTAHFAKRKKLLIS
jgi:hypothetical protein